MKTSKFLPAILIASAFITVQSLAQDALEYKFAKGKTYLFSTVTSSNMTQEMGGQEMKMSQGNRFLLRALVDEVKNGSAVLLVSADSAVTHSKNPMRDTTMVLTDLIGKRMKITVSKSGDILDRQVVDSVTFGGQMRGAQRELLSLLVLPVKPVKQGDKWSLTKNDTVDQMGGKIFTSTQFEFSHAGKENKLGHNCVRINFTAKISTNGNMKMQGMELFVEGGGKVSGTLYFDPDKGIPILVDSQTDTETTMAATGQQQMTIPISSSQKATTTLVQE